MQFALRQKYMGMNVTVDLYKPKWYDVFRWLWLFTPGFKHEIGSLIRGFHEGNEYIENKGGIGRCTRSSVTNPSRTIKITVHPA